MMMGISNAWNRHMRNAILFGLVILGIAPSTRLRLGGVMNGWLDWMFQYQILAGTFMALLFAAGVSALMMVRNAPVRVEPPSPMAKYLQEADAAVDDD